MKLREIQSPTDLKQLSEAELAELAKEIRQEMIATVSRRGGHLASNLGMVEVTLALHRVFDMPRDRIIFDVGHQIYVHKLVTGRYKQFDTLRSYGGMSGFPKREESEYDVFNTGHSSTAISAALGFARARDLKGEDYQVVAVVGDGAMTGGMCYEAMNDCGQTQTPLIVILNDNEMSISPNVGALSGHLTKLRLAKGYNAAKKRVKGQLPSVPVIGKPLYRLLNETKEFVKGLLTGQTRESFFDALGFHYYGPVDGHNIAELEKMLRRARELKRPVVLHVLTQKGRGYSPAEAHPDRFHGVGPFDIENGEVLNAPDAVTFSQAAGDALTALAAEDPRVVAITAAMTSGTGLSGFAQKYPKRLFDVGITEPHAATFAAGLAAGGLKPYFAVYASFFQRSEDQMIHDTALQNLPVTFLLDRAGLVGDDGATHHGVFDLAQLLPIPNMTVWAPADTNELSQMIAASKDVEGPLAIRYPRGSLDLTGRCKEICFTSGHWQTIAEGKDLTLLCVGTMVETGLAVRELLAKKDVSVRVVNCATVKPLDEDFLHGLTTPYATMEEHLLTGGFGAYVTLWAQRNRKEAPIEILALPDRFMTHGSRKELLQEAKLDAESAAARLLERMNKSR